MPLLDFILNLTAVLLWLSWRAVRFDPFTLSSPATLAGTVRRAQPLPVRRWHYLFALVTLLAIRAWIYWQIGPVVDWTPSLRLGAIAPPFRSDLFSLALTYSLLSFGAALASFYFWLVLLSLVNRNDPEAEPFQRLVKQHLGWLQSWLWPFKLILPFLVGAAFWMAINPLMAEFKIIPPCSSMLHRVEQAITVGLGVYLAWKYLICAVLLLYLLGSYIYLGNHPFWAFLTVTGRNLLTPFRFLPVRIGKVDFSPLIGIALVLLAAELGQRKLTVLYARLPL